MPTVDAGPIATIELPAEPRYGKDGGFHQELRSRVRAFLLSSGLPARGLPALYRKTALMFLWLACSYVLLVFAAGSLLYASDRYGAPTAVFNALLFNGVMLALGSLAAAFFVQRHAAPAARAGEVGERVAEPLLIGWATLWWIIGQRVFFSKPSQLRERT